MNRKQTLLILLGLIIIGEVSAQLPKVLIMDAKRLADVKKKWQEKDVAILRLTDSLQKQANGFLKMKPVSVMDKQFTPVSGNKHDYMSQAPYFWYDSTKPNGFLICVKMEFAILKFIRSLTEPIWVILKMQPGHYRWHGI